MTLTAQVPYRIIYCDQYVSDYGITSRNDVNYCPCCGVSFEKDTPQHASKNSPIKIPKSDDEKNQETASEYMMRVVDNLQYEICSYYETLPTVESVFEFHELQSVYGTDLMEGIIEEIELGGADPTPLQEFIKKYDLPWDCPQPNQPK